MIALITLTDSNPEAGGGIFICDGCDTKHGGFVVGKHKATHALVKVQTQESADSAASERAILDARMNALEGSLKEMQYKLDQNFVSVDEKVEFVKTRLGLKMEERLGKLEGRMFAMDGRLQRIEDLLLALGRSFGSGHGGSSQSPALLEADGPPSESEFSTWVRQLRNSS